MAAGARQPFVVCRIRERDAPGASRVALAARAARAHEIEGIERRFDRAVAAAAPLDRLLLSRHIAAAGLARIGVRVALRVQAELERSPIGMAFDDPLEAAVFVDLGARAAAVAQARAAGEARRRSAELLAFGLGSRPF